MLQELQKPRREGAEMAAMDRVNSFMTAHERDVFWRRESLMSELEKRSICQKPMLIKGNRPDPARQLEGVGILGGQPPDRIADAQSCHSP